MHCQFQVQNETSQRQGKKKKRKTRKIYLVNGEHPGSHAAVEHGSRNNLGRDGVAMQRGEPDIALVVDLSEVDLAIFKGDEAN